MKMLNLCNLLFISGVFVICVAEEKNNIMILGQTRISSDANPADEKSFVNYSVNYALMQENLHKNLFAAGGDWTQSMSSVMGTATSFMSKANMAVGVVTGVIEIAAGIASIVGMFQQLSMMKQQAKIQQKQFEEEMKMKTTMLCQTVCVLPWEPWASCSALCGGGTTSRKRQYNIDDGVCKGFNCQHHLAEKAECNLFCPNNGFPLRNGTCKCSRDYKGQCCEEDIYCNYPGKPKNGEVHGSWPTKFGGICTFDCHEGFNLNGPEYSLCTKNDSWSNQFPPKCKKIYCNRPTDMISDGYLFNDQLSYIVEDKAIYKCDKGYDLEGPSYRTCKSVGEEKGRFDSFTPLCVPKSCGVPNWPFNGGFNGTEFTIRNEIHYYCDTGFRLIGTQDRTCLESGSWTGNDPYCELIKCEAPIAPTNGYYLKKKEIYNFGETIRYDCERGYNMDGEEFSKCVKDEINNSYGPGGHWDNDSPKCKAVDCGEPGIFEKGVQDGNKHSYPNTVRYACFTGHVMRGSNVTTCTAEGSWSSRPPTCEECRKGYYKPDMNDPYNDCLPCPKNSETTTTASSNKLQCICKKGFNGPPGGPCLEIMCENLETPQNGSKAECSNKWESTCEFDCNDGYNMVRGSQKRECGENGHWSGNEILCKECPVETYKSDLRSCLPCPANSHTNGVGNMIDGCICDDGFDGPNGGPCDDINECAFNEGKGRCDQKCDNTLGGYKCSCTIPGYVIKDDDPNTCVVEKSCRDLTDLDAPEHGALVCHDYQEMNSKQCAVRCEKGFDFNCERTNKYELCGQLTGYKWSFENKNKNIPDCTEEMFPGIQMEAASYYLTKACRDLNETDQIKVKEEFAEALNNEQVCVRGKLKACQIKDMNIVCGRTITYFFSGELYSMDQVNLSFNVSAEKFGNNTLDCDVICEELHIPKESCEHNCARTYKRFLRAGLISSKTKMENFFADHTKATFSAVGRNFIPYKIHLSDVEVDCEEGMRIVDQMCLPCNAGTFYDKKTNECTPCKRGFYQPEMKKTSCDICPDGTITLRYGSKKCYKCPDKRWGVLCHYKCNVVNGECDPISGAPVCGSGYEGPLCTQDIDGCIDNECSKDNVCQDVKAPGTGYNCI